MIRRCPTGKQPYRNQDEAREGMRGFVGSVYTCPRCGHLHVTRRQTAYKSRIPKWRRKDVERVWAL